MRPIILICLFLVSGCATLSREECMVGDWRGLGLQDGLMGEPSQRLSEHMQACGEYHIAVDNNAYFAGREQGLREYCRIDNAFNQGLNGRPYHRVCPPEIDGWFSQYHAAAYNIYQNRSELDRISSEISGKESRLYDKKLTDKDREHIRHEIRDLDYHHNRLRDELYFHERQLDDMRRQAQSYRGP